MDGYVQSLVDIQVDALAKLLYKGVYGHLAGDFTTDAAPNPIGDERDLHWRQPIRLMVDPLYAVKDSIIVFIVLAGTSRISSVCNREFCVCYVYEWIGHEASPTTTGAIALPPIARLLGESNGAKFSQLEVRVETLEKLSEAIKASCD